MLTIISPPIATSLEAAVPNNLYIIDIVLSGTQQHKAIAISPEILNRAGSSAIRIVERESGNEVPFFVHSAAEISSSLHTMQLNPIGEAIYDEYYHLDFEMEIRRPIDPLVSHLLLRASQNRDFLKNITVLGSYDGQNWIELASALVYQVSSAAQHEIYLNGIHRYRYYRLKVPTPQEFIEFSGVGYVDSERLEQVPFISYADAIFEMESRNGSTIVTITGVYGTNATMQNLRVTEIRLETDTIFMREFRPLTQSTVVTQGFTLYNLFFMDMFLSNTRIPFPGSPQTSTISFSIIDYDNRPIDISRITVEYITQYLVFRAEEGMEYALIFGGELHRPRYDIENFRDLILAEGYDQVHFGGTSRLLETLVHETSVYRDYNLLFNIAIIAAAILLTGIVVADFSRRKKGKGDNE